MAIGFTYEDRIGKGGLVLFTPDFEFFTFEYTDFEIGYTKKTSAFDFAETDGQLIQDNGIGATDIPLTLFISGPNYDKDADKFIASALLKGRSELFHPVYGIKDIVITEVTRRDALQSGRGQAIITLTISETIIPERPDTGLQTKGAITADMDALESAQSAAFAADFLTELVSDAIAAKNRVLGFVADVKSAVQAVLSTVAAIQREFDNLEKSIISNIDFFLSAPLQLASQLQRLINSPARLANNVKNRVEIYKALYKNLLNIADGTGQDAKNQNAEKQLQTVAILSSISESLLFPENEPDAEVDTGETLGFLTQNDAITSATDLANSYIEIQDFLDEQQKTNESIPLEERFQVADEVARLIKKITAETAKNLIRLSFSLKKEKITIVENDTNIISLCFDIYGTTSNEQLDFFIQTNNLTGEELLQISKGRQIKSYA